MAPKAAAPKPVSKAAPAAKIPSKAVAGGAAAKPAAKAAAGKAPVAAAVKPVAKAAPAPKAAAGNGVYVRGLGDADADVVKAMFTPMGSVAHIRLRRHKFAIVFFEAATSVKKAIDAFNGKEIKGRVTTVSMAKSMPKADKHQSTATIFVSPLFHQNTTRTQVRGIFAGCGKITKLRTYRNNFAFITFDSAANALKVIKEKNGTQFRNKKLLVKASIRR